MITLRKVAYGIALVKFQLFTGVFLSLWAAGERKYCWRFGLLSLACLCVIVGCCRVFREEGYD